MDEDSGWHDDPFESDPADEHHQILMESAVVRQPLISALLNVLALHGTAPASPRAVDWRAFQRAYAPLCRVLLECKSEGTSDDEIRMIAASLAGVLARHGGAPKDPAKLESWLRRIRNVLINYRDEE